MNALTEAGVLVEDKLFATLDTRTRRWRFRGGGDALLSDTVGFIRDLPHALVASFKATLEEARQADLLLHVVDASSPEAERQIQAVKAVLAELGLEDHPTLLVLNKADKVPDRSFLDVLKAHHAESVAISAARGEGLDRLEAAVRDALERACARGRGRDRRRQRPRPGLPGPARPDPRPDLRRRPRPAPLPSAPPLPGVPVRERRRRPRQRAAALGVLKNPPGHVSEGPGSTKGCSGNGSRRIRARFEHGRIELNIEWLRDRLHEVGVVHQNALAPDEEVTVLGDVEIVDRLVLVDCDRADFDHATRHAEPIPGFRSRAIVQPLPAFQKRWIPVATIGLAVEG